MAGREVTYNVRDGEGKGFRFEERYGFPRPEECFVLEIGRRYIVDPLRKNKKGRGRQGTLERFRLYSARGQDPTPRAVMREDGGAERFHVDPLDLRPLDG